VKETFDFLEKTMYQATD